MNLTRLIKHSWGMERLHLPQNLYKQEMQIIRESTIYTIQNLLKMAEMFTI